MTDEAGSRKSYEQLVADKDSMRIAIKKLDEELGFNIEELVKSEAKVEKLNAEVDQLLSGKTYWSEYCHAKVQRDNLREALEETRSTLTALDNLGTVIAAIAIIDKALKGGE